jgi:hypothetical protein
MSGALGVILDELLTAKVPFDGEGTLTPAVKRKILRLDASRLLGIDPKAKRFGVTDAPFREGPAGDGSERVGTRRQHGTRIGHARRTDDARHLRRTRAHHGSAHRSTSEVRGTVRVRGL